MKIAQPDRDPIAALGTALGPDVLRRCRELFEPEQAALAARVPALAADIAYGPHERHRLDLYGTDTGPKPVVVFVHGGGFVQGDKSADGWANGAVGRWAAEQGWLGAVINYRLAPDHTWPSGSEDVLTAIDWIAANSADYGGDPGRIVLIGTSAGSVHIAGALKLRPDLHVRGVVMLSGLYGYTPLDPKDERYYGEQSGYAERMPRAAVAATQLPLFLACAEFDPPRFQAEFLGLMQERLQHFGAMPRGYIAAGHNHYTMAMHLGTSDTRLADELTSFIKNLTR